MQDDKIKLQDAFNKGYVPADIRKAMADRGHVGQVWIVENADEPRLGVGYKTISENGTEENHIHWYEQKAVRAMLKEI